jgi:tetratricopeptide (TPR) repeat protein
LLCNQQKNDEGLNELDRVLEMRPDDPEASFLKATILVDRGATREALPLLRNALNAGTALQPKVHGLLGTVYASLGDQKAAIAELKAASKIDPDGRYHYQLYRLYKSAGDAAAAAEALRESVRRHAEAERRDPVPDMYRIKLEPSL